MSMKDLRQRSADALSRLAAERSQSGAFPSADAQTTPAAPGVALRPITAPGARALLQPTIDALNERALAAEQALAATREAHEAALAHVERNPVELELDRIVEVPGRRRRLSPEEFAELRANLEVNDLVHPVVVRRIPAPATNAGGAASLPDVALYELVSGYNRLDVFRILGRRKIPVRVMDVQEAEVDAAAFWSNLLQPSLPDYEKYQGLKQYRDQRQLSDAAVARQAGISKTLMSFLMSFDQLPEGAREALDANPRLFGATAARRFAKAAAAGKHASVMEAISLLSAGDMSQEDALRIADGGSSSRSMPPGRKVLASTVQIRNGQFDLCRMVAKGSSLRLEFKLEEHRERAQEIVAQAMEDLAARLSALESGKGEL